jgi:hypothetical protein
MAQEWMHVTLTDAFGRLTHIRREMQAHATLIEYQQEIQNFANTLSNVSGLGVVRADFVQTGLATPTAAQAGSNVDVGATFVGWNEDGSGTKISTKVPGFLVALVDSDGSIDLEQSVVADYLANYADAGDFYLSDGETVADWIKGTLDR